jgi:hypothetical protein
MPPSRTTDNRHDQPEHGRDRQVAPGAVDERVQRADDFRALPADPGEPTREPARIEGHEGHDEEQEEQVREACGEPGKYDHELLGDAGKGDLIEGGPDLVLADAE